MDAAADSASPHLFDKSRPVDGKPVQVQPEMYRCQQCRSAGIRRELYFRVRRPTIRYNQRAISMRRAVIRSILLSCASPSAAMMSLMLYLNPHSTTS